MTTMHTGGYGSFTPEEIAVEERTSVLAILALVFGIVCVPGFGVLGAIFGIAALMFITNSGGRLVGKGLAIAGIAVSILMTFVWAAVLWGMLQASSAFHKVALVPAESLMRQIDGGDFTAARSALGTTGAKITDADFEKFRTGYQAELGKFSKGPASVWEYGMMFADLGQSMQRLQGNSNSMIPMPMRFEKGSAVLALSINQTSKFNNQGQQAEIPFSNIQILTKSGASYTLYDPDNRAIPPAPGTNAGNAETGKPDAPDAPKPDAPKAPPPPKTAAEEHKDPK